jgi:monoamine oxidase
MTPATIIIIGGGLSGLTSLHTLLTIISNHPASPPTTIHLYEATANFGGRLTNSCTGVDLGAAWSWEGDVNLRRLANELNVTTLEQPWRGLVSQKTGPKSSQTHQARRGEVACGDGGSRFKGGTKAIVDNIIVRINELAAKDDRITLRLETDTACTAVTADENGDTLTATTTSSTTQTSSEVTADAVILAMPTYAIANAVDFTPELPAATKRGMIQTATWMHGTGKATITYPTPFWKNSGFSGTAMGGDVFDITWDNSYGDTHAIAGFLSGGDGGSGTSSSSGGGGGFFAAMTGGSGEAKSLQDRVIDDMVAWYGEEARGGTVNYKTWDNEALYGHCGHSENARSHSYGQFKAHPSMRNCYFAGTESESEHGHMEGAVVAGLRTGKQAFEVVAKKAKEETGETAA